MWLNTFFLSSNEFKKGVPSFVEKTMCTQILTQLIDLTFVFYNKNVAKASSSVCLIDPSVETDDNKYFPLQLSFQFSFFFITFGFSQRIWIKHDPGFSHIFF